jgi:hypothetical protein
MENCNVEKYEKELEDYDIELKELNQQSNQPPIVVDIFTEILLWKRKVVENILKPNSSVTRETLIEEMDRLVYCTHEIFLENYVLFRICSELKRVYDFIV